MNLMSSLNESQLKEEGNKYSALKVSILRGLNLTELFGAEEEQEEKRITGQRKGM